MTEQPTGPKNLQVFVDGAALPAEEARAFWARFSAYMEEHKGDLGGFAKAEGFTSVHPDITAEGAVLRASRTAAQGAYVNVSKGAPAADAGASTGEKASAGGPKGAAAGKPGAPKLGNPFVAGGARSFGGGGRPGQGGGKPGGGFGPPKRGKPGGNRGR